MAEFELPPPSLTPQGGLPQMKGLSPEEQQAVEQGHLETLEGLKDSLAEGGFTAEELNLLRDTATLLMGDPKLSSPNKALIQSFLDNVNALRPDAPRDGEHHVCISNAWLTNSSTVAILIASLDIISILSKIKKQESELRITISEVKIDTAVQIGELIKDMGWHAAELCKQEAALATTQMGLAMASFASTCAIGWARQGMLSKAKSPEETMGVNTQIQLIEQGSQSISQAIGKGIESTIHMRKAMLELLKSEVESVEKVLERLIGVNDDTINALRNAASDIAKQIEAIFGLAESQLRALQQIYTAS